MKIRAIPSHVLNIAVTSLGPFVVPNLSPTVLVAALRHYNPEEEPEAPETLLTPAQLAKRCGVHVGSVRRWCREGKDSNGDRVPPKLPSVVLGGRRRIRESDLERLMEEGL